MRASTLLALLPLGAVAAPSRRSAPAPILVPRGGSAIDGKYIVRMKSDAISTAASSAINSIEADADYEYNHSFQGFAASVTEAELEALKNNPMVDYIEQDAIVTISATEEDAPWGLARISSAKPGGTTYTYDDSAGDGTCAYVVDTGIDTSHPEFEGRATWLKNFADKDDSDGQGHGTHVSGTIGSKTYGVAKKTKLFAVKVLDSQGQGTNSGVIAGMEFVAKDGPTRSGCDKGVVVNMSLGGSTSKAVNTAAAAITKAGLFLAVAAGNEAASAGTSSPASEPSVCTVGASDEKDAIAEFSNFGSLVDVFAPGVGVLSTFPGGKTETLDGTSMASPHVAGLGAYLMGTGKKADGLCEYMASSGIAGAISGAPNGTTTTLINNGNK